MYRPFLFFVSFFVSGIVLGTFAKAPGVFIVISIVSLLGSIITQNKKTRTVLIVIVIIFFGAFYYNFRFDKMAGTIVDFAEKQQTLVGVVTDAPTVKEDRVIYNVKALYLCEEEGDRSVTGKVRLSSLVNDNSTIYRYGDIIKFTGKLKIPQGRRNPNGFNYRAYLLQKGISTTAFSREIEKIGKYKTNPFVVAALNLRERLTTFYDSHLPPNLSSLMVGIALGIKDNIPGETMKAVKNGGVAHVLAVSGLHTGIIYAALELIFYRFGLSGTIYFVIGSIAIIFYSFMAGLTPSVLRAAIMIMVFMLAKVAGRENDPLNSLCFSAAILLFLNPLNLFSVSFQLSYAAVVGIILFFTYFRRILEGLPVYLRNSLSVILSAQLVVGPILAYYFFNISLIGFFTNLLVVPLVSLILISGLFSGIIGILFTPLGSVFVKVPGFLLSIVEKIILISSKIPFATIVVPAMTPINVVLYFTALAIVFGFLPFADKIKSQYKNTCAICLMVLAFIAVFMSSRGFEVTFIDVGQGDSILIQTEGKKVVLIDGGGMPPYYSGDFDTGDDIVLPFLYSKGIKKIDAVIFTHFDDDHARGLLSILRSMKVENIVYGLPEDLPIYEEMLEIVREKQIKTIHVKRGDQFTIDNVTFDVLNPVVDTQKDLSSNDNSVVLKMAYKGMKFLFTGDLEYEGERSLISSGIDIRAHVLKVGHHGSHTSTSQEFLSKVRPLYGVISAGKDNTFGHPSPQVLESLNDSGVTILRTDNHGAVSFKISRKGVRINTSIPGELKKP
jgi:competence protein ComEC